jgi:hydroxyethylthiazole kinase
MTTDAGPAFAETLLVLRAKRPLVHNITNLVVTNFTANALLALGASPVMSHAPEEVEAFAAMAGALVINIGTLDAPSVASMHLAARRAAAAGVPWILDPVGVGATDYRTRTTAALLTDKPSVIRGNAGEIMACAGAAGAVKGVDSLAGSDAAVDAARQLSRTSGAVVAVTGATDYVVSGDDVAAVEGGHPMSQQVTGTGCAATAVIGAFMAILPPREAALCGLAAMKRAAERAARSAAGPGSFAMGFVDALASDLT